VLHYLMRAVGRPFAVRRLALADPVLYLLVVTMAFLPAGMLAVSPLQAEGIATGQVFVTGLVAVWIVAFSERASGAGPVRRSTIAAPQRQLMDAAYAPEASRGPAVGAPGGTPARAGAR
jgi:hypothetical protein